MLGNGEIIERNINEFQKIQAHMMIARKENAVETYESLKHLLVQAQGQQPLSTTLSQPGEEWTSEVPGRGDHLEFVRFSFE